MLPIFLLALDILWNEENDRIWFINHVCFVRVYLIIFDLTMNCMLYKWYQCYKEKNIFYYKYSLS